MSKFEPIIWHEGLSIGNPDIDVTHRYLVDQYNKLVFHSKNEGFDLEFAQILSALTDYALEHFAQEEDYMQRMGYPLFDEHKAYHREFILKVSNWNSDFLTPDRPNEKTIIRYLEKWWINHIQKTDKDFEDFKRDSGIEIKY